MNVIQAPDTYDDDDDDVGMTMTIGRLASSGRERLVGRVGMVAQSARRE